MEENLLRSIITIRLLVVNVKLLIITLKIYVLKNVIKS